MEENLIDRIGDEYLNPNFQDGQILLNTDINEIVSIVKEGINANFNDIQKIQNGSLQVGNSSQLDGATLTKFSDGELEGADNKIPTAQLVKSYVDNKVQEVKDTTEVGQLVENLNQLGIEVGNKVDKEDLVSEETAGTDKAYNCDYINELFESGVGDSLPIGTIVEYDGNNIPDGFEEVVEPQDATVYVGPTEPTDGQDVWVQKGKNLIEEIYFKEGYSISSDTGLETQMRSNGCGTNYIKVEPNTYYTLSANKSINNLRLSEYKDNKEHIQRTAKENVTSITIKTTPTTKYLRWSLNYDNITTVTLDILKGIDLQLEQGEVATEYEPYIPKRVFVKNDNDVYEEFYNETNLENYSLGEQRVGTWVDGKPLYRKVLNFGSATANTYKSIWSYADANIDKFIKFEGITQNNSSNVIMPLVHAYDENNWNCTIYASTEEKKIFVVPRGTDISSGCAIVEYTKTTD